jgi:hypothetical protein
MRKCRLSAFDAAKRVAHVAASKQYFYMKNLKKRMNNA